MALRPHVVAVFNTSEDTTDLRRVVFEHPGFVVITPFTNPFRDGKVDLEAFMRQHQPRVIVYDIAIPYEQNWRLYQHMRSAPACQGVSFVLTTTNIRHVRQLAGTEEIHEIVGKPYDLDEILGAVRQAADESVRR
jgi:CheY-like chemotaxis protein